MGIRHDFAERSDSQLALDAVDMRTRGARAQTKLRGDLRDGTALNNQGKDLIFTRAERMMRIGLLGRFQWRRRGRCDLSGLRRGADDSQELLGRPIFGYVGDGA